MASVVDNLFQIIVSVPKAVQQDFLFPARRLSREEQLTLQVRKLGLLVQRLEDSNAYQASVIKDQSREISDLNEQLKIKDQEIKRLKDIISSLELRLQEKNHR